MALVYLVARVASCLSPSVDLHEVVFSEQCKAESPRSCLRPENTKPCWVKAMCKTHSNVLSFVALRIDALFMARLRNNGWIFGRSNPQLKNAGTKAL